MNLRLLQYKEIPRIIIPERNEEFVWTTYDGTKLRLYEMSTDHIINCKKHLADRYKYDHSDHTTKQLNTIYAAFNSELTYREAMGL